MRLPDIVQRVRSLDHFSQALAFGAAVLAVFLVGYLWILFFWPWQWAPPPSSDGVVDQAGVLSLKFAFGQVYTAFVGILLAGVLGFYAVKEFGEAHQVPNLQLTFDDGQETLEIDPEVDNIITLHLHNHSVSVAVWYIVHFETPFLKGWRSVRKDSTGMHVITAKDFNAWQPIVGSKDNWREMIAPSEDYFLSQSPDAISFRSKGSEAVYHNFSLTLCQFVLPKHWLGDDGVDYTNLRFACVYKIGLDQGAPLEGTLHLRAKPKPQAG